MTSIPGWPYTEIRAALADFRVAHNCEPSSVVVGWGLWKMLRDSTAHMEFSTEFFIGETNIPIRVDSTGILEGSEFFIAKWRATD